jgi:hypothetical protein
MLWLQGAYPDLVGEYKRLYRNGAYLPSDYRASLRDKVISLINKHGLESAPRSSGRSAQQSDVAHTTQLPLF